MGGSGAEQRRTDGPDDQSGTGQKARAPTSAPEPLPRKVTCLGCRHVPAPSASPRENLRASTCAQCALSGAPCCLPRLLGKLVGNRFRVMVFVLVCSFITVVVVRPVLASDFRVQTSCPRRWIGWMRAGVVPSAACGGLVVRTFFPLSLVVCM